MKETDKTKVAQTIPSLNQQFDQLNTNTNYSDICYDYLIDYLNVYMTMIHTHTQKNLNITHEHTIIKN